MTPLIVGGTFDASGGKVSKIVAELAVQTGWPVVNGGTLEDLAKIDFKAHDVLVWMPNVDNAIDKILPKIKQDNPSLLLVSSKRVIEKTYTEFDVVSRLLKTRSNLGIMIDTVEGKLRFRLLDPLGNVYCDTLDAGDLGRALKSRVGEIKAMSRIGSQSVGKTSTAKINPEFVELVRELGDVFSQHVNAVNPERFLGNASAKPTDRITRCCHGFPGERAEGDDVYLISRRNVDKTTLSENDFVAVKPDEDKVRYFGDTKPSVDAPIQIRLFNHFNNVNYIVHGHLYAEDAPMTESKIPCGHVEEFNEIASLATGKDATNFCVNLKGHGCLILAEDIDYIRSVKFKSRPFLEK